MSAEQERLDLQAWLGRSIQVRVDRPLGSRHPRFGYRYPLNYGFVPGTLAGDGCEVDAYILGPGIPVSEFSGRVVAVVHRRDDVEDKLVVSDQDGWSVAAIEAAVAFQEQFFDSQVIVAGALG